MKKSLLLLLLLSIMTSCSKDYLFKKHQAKIYTQVIAMKNNDEAVRRFNSMVLLKYKMRDSNTISDSLDMAGSMNLISTYDFSKVASIESQAAKLPEKLQKAFDEDDEQGRKLMSYVDRVNREKLYEMVKKYGYISYYNRKWADTVYIRTGITIMLTHYQYKTPKEKKFLKLMIKEYLAGRVSKGEMRRFLWSIDDNKKGQSSEYKVNIEDWKKKAGL